MKRAKSFTLLELIIAMAIISMVMAGVFMALTIGMRLFVDEMNRSNAYLEADRGMNRVTNELIGAKEIVAASSREVTFWLEDVNGNGSREANETVKFTWSGSPESRLNRIVTVETLPISYGVTSFALTYDNPLAIKLINIQLTVGREPNMVTLESSVKLRNI